MTMLHFKASSLGPHGPEIVAAMRAGLDYLDQHSIADLCRNVGRQLKEVPVLTAVDKTALQDSYGGSEREAPDDFLVGRGLFYITERRRLCLDCTSGHYQMLWGYGPPALCAAVQEATEAGIVWDNHANLPQTPVKWLAHRLVQCCNGPSEPEPLDTVLLGICTGSVACESALKIQLCSWQQRNGPADVPGLIVLNGHYHGTNMVSQYKRGMWKRYVQNLEIVVVEPNDIEQLDAAFRRLGPRTAAFWAEPILMNREAITLTTEYLRRARTWCTEVGAAMCIDEIQTGFWQPEIFAFRSMGFTPDMVIVGKGMTAGFHPLAAVVYKSKYDLLEQYDAINTNGSAPLASYLGLRCLEMVAEDATRFTRIGDRFMNGLTSLADRYRDRIIAVNGVRHLAGLKFRNVDDALDMHRRALAAGLWTRVHAYHAGHSTLLMKLSLAADETIVDGLLACLNSLFAGEITSRG